MLPRLHDPTHLGCKDRDNSPCLNNVNKSKRDATNDQDIGFPSDLSGLREINKFYSSYHDIIISTIEPFMYVASSILIRGNPTATWHKAKQCLVTMGYMYLCSICAMFIVVLQHFYLGSV